MLTPIYTPKKGKMRVAGLVSGSGKSLVKIIEQQMEMEDQEKAPYEVVGIFTDNPKSNAPKIGKDHNLPVFINDIREFYKSRRKKITDQKVREAFDFETVQTLKPLKPDVLIYAGYVWATTAPLVDAFLGINVHPADLTIIKEGKRAYTGAYGVRDALMAGETELRSTAHIATSEIDGGPILLISEPVKVEKNHSMNLEESSRHYLKLLNEKTRILFAKVIKELAEGVFKRDETGLLHYGETPIPRGYKL